MNPNAFNTSPVMHGQIGFTLLELLIVLLLGALITTGLLRNQSIEADVGLALTQATRYQVLSAATGRYMADNYSGIKAIAANDAASKTPTCSIISLAADEPKIPVALNACNFKTTATSSPVVNALQPTVNELQTAGYLSSNFDPRFVWPGLGVVYSAYKPPTPTDTNYPVAAMVYATHVQALCNSKPVAVDNTCDQPQLRSLVFNTQPFADSRSWFRQSRLENLSTARDELGANGMVSYDYSFKDDGRLYSAGNVVSLDNPLRRNKNSSSADTVFKGVEGILAMQNLYQPPPASGQ